MSRAQKTVIVTREQLKDWTRKLFLYRDQVQARHKNFPTMKPPVILLNVVMDEIDAVAEKAK